MTRPRDWRTVPASTYRLQLNREFGFTSAAALVPYLDALGIGAAYTSPVLMSRPGSPHGYDIVDHSRLDPAIGGDEGFAVFADALRTRGLGLVLDIVPNHMAADANANPWWRDVLENGSCSRHAEAFDIDWAPLKAEIHGRLLLPILGDQYGVVLERGELVLAYTDGAFEIHYFDHRLPVNPRQATIVLRLGLDDLRRAAGNDEPDVREFLSILTGLDHLPPYTSTSPELIEERDREKEVLRARMARLTTASARVRAHVDAAVAAANGAPGAPESFDRLHALLDAQPYRLAYWRVAAHEINYRRFFDVNELAAIRMERPEVFDATHGLIARLLEDGAVQGLRVDHPDGLFDPAEYFDRLARLVPGREAPYVIAEKILSDAERLPRGWAIDGTTGYDFLNDVNGVFVDPAGAAPLRRTWTRVSGRRAAIEDEVYESKKLILETSLASELNVLADELNRLSEADRRSRDFTLNALRDLLVEVVACFPIYRTYLTAAGCTAADRQAIATALRTARRRNLAMEATRFEFLRGVLLPSGLPDADTGRVSGARPADFDARLRFAITFQQVTAPVQAKGLEDTAFYRHNTLISLNEVGGEPGRFGRSVEAFHQANAERVSEWPFGLLATSTHDTKLGEDARMRVTVLAELAGEWNDAVRRWQRLTSGARRRVEGAAAPDGNDLYRFFQSLVACWPIDGIGSEPARDALVARLQRYMVKAMREAKLRTSWISEHQAYETAVEQFVAAVLAGPDATRFLADFEPLARRVAALAAVYSLGQLTLKIASPGVPDFYQGTETWTLTLVDPDNRAPVDFAARQSALSALEPLLIDVEAPERRGGRPGLAEATAALAAAWTDGRAKLYVTTAGLRLRRAHADVFLTGEYVPLAVKGPAPAGAVAFARRLGERIALVVVPRLVAGITDPDAGPARPARWGDAVLHLPAGLDATDCVNVFTGERLAPAGGQLAMSDLLRSFPVALLWGRTR